ALRRTVMSTAPKARWSGRPSTTSDASKIMPAQVPSTGSPSASRLASGSNRPEDSSSIDIVVDSPPGITSASTRSSCSGVRISDGSAPRSARRRAWAANAPWGASTPTRVRVRPWGPRAIAAHERQVTDSPTAVGQAQVELVHADAGHRRAEPAADLGEDLRVAEVRGGLDDGLGARRRISALEDARAHEHRL